MSVLNSARCGIRGTGLWPAGLAALALLAGCGSDRRGSAPILTPGDDEGAPRRPSLFISPSGEPFRARPGEPYPVGRWFSRADANGDGKLTRDEFIADAARFFAVLDTNHDGVIDGFEVKAYETDVAPELVGDQAPVEQFGPDGKPVAAPPAGAPQQGGRRGGGRRGGQGAASSVVPSPLGAGFQANGAAPYDLLPDREPVAGADLDISSKITLDNFKAKAGQRFDRLDTKMQGYLLLAELPKTPVQKVLERQLKRQAQGAGQGPGQAPPPSR